MRMSTKQVIFLVLILIVMLALTALRIIGVDRDAPVVKVTAGMGFLILLIVSLLDARQKRGK